MWSYHQYHNQRPPRQRRRRRRRRPRPRPRPRRRRRASAGVLAATFTAVAKLVTPTAVPTVVPTALMHQNKAIATAATAFARNLRGALDLLPVPEGNGLCPIRFTRPFFSRICASKRRHPRFKGHSAATDKRGGGLLFVLSPQSRPEGNTHEPFLGRLTQCDDSREAEQNSRAVRFCQGQRMS